MKSDRELCPAAFPHAPFDDAEREAVPFGEGPCCTGSLLFLCTRRADHAGDHVAGTISGKIADRWRDPGAALAAFDAEVAEATGARS